MPDTRAALFLMAPLFLYQADPFAVHRDRMVREQIEARGVANPEVLTSMRSTPRHLFVPEDWRPQAYSDRPLPIGFGQTISQPYIVALMTELLEPAPDQRVLEIGTGSGYQAAVLASLVRQVYTIEIVPELEQVASKRLESLNYRNVVVKQGDGYRGWPEQAPFDRIILTAAPPEIPQVLLDQVKPGGKLIAPVGGRDIEQQLLVIAKGLDGKLRTKSLHSVMFVPMVRPQKK